MKVLGWAGGCIVQRRFWLSLSLLAALGGIGCHKSSGISITLSPTSQSVLVNQSAQFTPTVTGSSNTVTWEVNGVTGGNSPNATPPTCGGTTGVTCYGTISTSGFYVAPSTVPANPTVSITATVSGTGASATSTVTITSAVSVSLNAGTVTIGTGESYVFSATVTGVPTNAVTTQEVTIGNTTYNNGCNSVSPNPPAVPSCNAVVWTLNGAGTINATTGVYTAPNSTANGSSILITATSVYDTSAAATGSVSLVQAMDPTLLSIGPTTGARGTPLEDVYLSGTNFISTTNVFINGVQVPAADVTVSSVTCASLQTTNTSGTAVPTPPCTAASLTTGSTVIRVRVLDSFLAGSSFALPSTNAVSLVFTAARQSGSQVQCSPDPSACQLVLSPERPSIVGSTPDSIIATAGSFEFTLDGGFYGTLLNAGTGSGPVVTAQFNGQPVSSTISSTNPDRQLTATVTAGAASQPGLYEVGVASDTSGIPPATSNLTVQPNYSSGAVLTATAIIPVGQTPSSIAINTATGIAVVANQASNDVTLINLANHTVVASVCTANVGLTEPCPTGAGASAPTGVAVDNIHNVALVTNSAQNSIAVVDLTHQVVTFVINLTSLINGADNANPANISEVPVAVGINPVASRALVAYRGANFGLILDLTPLSQATPAAPDVVGVVNISTGANPRVAVSPNLNWAIVTPGGVGSLSVINLTQQSSNAIVSAGASGVSRSGGTVTVTTTATTSLVAGQSVLIQNVADPTYDGIYTVTSIPTSTTFTYSQLASLPNSTSGGGTISFSLPVSSIATQTTVTGVGINDITFQAVLADPGISGDDPVTIFNILDQSISSALTNGVPTVGMIGAAFNPLANIAVAVNQVTDMGYVISPGTGGQNPVPPQLLATFSVGNGPWDLAVDPGTNTAVVINQFDNTATVVPLASVALRTPQILQVVTTCGTVTCGPGPNQIFVPSSLTAGPAPSPVTLTVIGSGFTAGSSTVRVDGTPLTSTVVSSREITATLPSSMQMTPRRFAVDVSSSGSISNSLSLVVIQAVSVAAPMGGTCSPSPIGVAVDAANNVAVVTDINCNDVYLIHLPSGLGQTVSVGTAPLGVAVSSAPQAALAQNGGGGLAVVANTGSTNVELLNDLNGDVISTISTEADPSGVAIDPVLGQAVVTANGANDLDVLSTAGTSGETYTATPVGLGPVPVAVDPVDHVAAVGNQTANTVSLVPLVGSTVAQQTFNIQLPTGIVYDPVGDDFIIESSLSNQVTVINPVTQIATTVNVGINPTSMAYNYETGTLITSNTAGGNVTLVDLISDVVRDEFPLTSSSEFAMDIQPQTNLAVVADGANARVLLLPLP